MENDEPRVEAADPGLIVLSFSLPLSDSGASGSGASVVVPAPFTRCWTADAQADAPQDGHSSATQ